MLMLHETAYLLRFYISDEILMSSDMFCLSCLQQNCTDGVERVTPRLINKVTHVVPSKSIFVIRSQQLSEELTFTMHLSRRLFPCNQRNRHIYELTASIPVATFIQGILLHSSISDTEIIVVLNRAQTPCFFEKCALSISATQSSSVIILC